MGNKRLRIATRESRLALLQVEEVVRLLRGLTAFEGYDFEIVKGASFGDRHKEVSLMAPGLAPDFFTREMDEAIVSGAADIAVHSAKDLGYPLPAGIEVVALTRGEVKTDSLVARGGLTLSQLPQGSRVGTSSPQRKAELLALRPDVEVVAIRGTIEERIAQVESGAIDALIVATCALRRLGLEGKATEELPFATHPLQGNLAITAREGSPLKELLAEIDIRRSFGRVSLVGFGPGDPELLTIKGERLLAEADVIFYDDLTNDAFLHKYRAELTYVGKRSGKHSHHQDEINELIYRAAISGKRVVRLKGGDPMIFAHGREEVDYLRSRLVEVGVVPGISSGVALASLTSIPLTHRGLSQSAAFLLGHSESPATPDVDTLVYYMGGSHANVIAQALIDSGRHPDTPAALVSNVSLPNQRTIFTTLGELRWSIYRETPVLIIVGQVVGLEARGGRTYDTGTQSPTPLINITPLDVDIPDPSSFDWVVFTSRHGVRHFTRPIARVKVASVGPVTSAELRQRGVSPDFESPTESAEGIIAHFATLPPGQQILLPRSDKGLKALSDGLMAQGHRVTDLATYANTPNTEATKIDLSQYDKVIFHSPSAADVFKSLYADEQTKHLLLIAKGKTTYEAIQTI